MSQQLRATCGTAVAPKTIGEDRLSCSSAVHVRQVTSADGITIVFERSGAGWLPAMLVTLSRVG